MNRSRIGSALTLVFVAGFGASARRRRRADEKTLVKFEGMLGRVVNIFGGRLPGKASSRRWPSKATARRR